MYNSVSQEEKANLAPFIFEIYSSDSVSQEENTTLTALIFDAFHDVSFCINDELYIMYFSVINMFW